MAPTADKLSGYSYEIQLLTLTARTQISDPIAAEIRHLTQQSLNWTSFIQLAHDHGVLPLVSHILYRCQPRGLPSHIQSLLQEKTQERICRNLHLSKELVLIVQVLQANQIPCLPFKGPSLARLAYGNLALRQFLDLDILVPRELIPKAREILAAEGYTPRQDFLPEQERKFLDTQIGYDFLSLAKGVSIELHWNLVNRCLTFPVQTEDMWSDPLEINLLGTRVHTLNLNLLLLYLCVHANKHHWEQLKWICDIAELLRHHPQLDWDQIQHQAAKLRSLRILYLGLALADQLLEAPLPMRLHQTIAEDRQVLLLTKKVIRRIGDSPSHLTSLWQDHWLYLQSREQWQDRWIYLHHLGQLLLLPSVTDRNWVHLPKPLEPLYFLVRPVRVLVNSLSDPKLS